MGCDHYNIYSDERENPDMALVLILCELSDWGFYVVFFVIVLYFLTQLTFNANVLFLQLLCVFCQ